MADSTIDTNDSTRIIEENDADAEADRYGSLTPEEYHNGVRAQMKSALETSTLLVGFAIIALAEFDYEHIPFYLLIAFGAVTITLVSVHLLAVFLAARILYAIDSQGVALILEVIFLYRPYIKLARHLSSTIGVPLFLIEVGVMFFLKFGKAQQSYDIAAYITIAMMVPVSLVYAVLRYKLGTKALKKKASKHQLIAAEQRNSHVQQA